MGGKSTLHGTVSSDSVGTQEKFDLKSWQGLTELLKAGKNALKPEAYAEFRNLVLSYAQHGGDLEYKKRIDDIVATFGRPLVVATGTLPQEQTKEEASPLPTQAQNSRRIAPRFGDAPTPLQPLPVEKLAVTPEPIPAQESAPVEVPVAEPIIEPPMQPVHEPVPATPEPEPQISVPPIPEPIPSPTPTIPPPVPVEVPKAPEPVPQPEPVPPQGEQVPFMSLEQCKVRIAEIKRAVNTHFGNPVALMAVPNNLGKVYMTALLSALKASTPGAPGGVGNAMVELERAYKTLIEGDMVAPITAPKAPEPIPEPVPVVVKEESVAESVIETPVQPVPEPVPTTPEPEQEQVVATPEIPVPPAPVPEQQFPPVIIEPVIDAPLPPEPQSAKEPEPAPEPASVVLEIKPEPIPEPEPESVSVPEIPKAPEPIPVPETISQQDPEHMSILERIESEQGLPPLGDTENKETSRAEVMQSAFAKTDTVISAVVGSVHKKLPPISGSIAELVEDEASGYDTWQGATGPTSPVHPDDSATDDIIHRENKYTKKGIVDTVHPDELQEQGIDAGDIAVKQSELVSPQITTMLNKLLHEWSIFDGSGLFGMGPGGAEHPLYKQLSTLTMGEVVGGRWDGADPKAIKVIKQYVDAWRNEQGITYTTNETFEHYLRRVVQRIVKRQST